MAETPKRIQLSRARGWRMPPNTVKVDRSTRWGNPFPISRGTMSCCGQVKPIWFVGTWDGPGLWTKESEAAARAWAVRVYRVWLGGRRQGFLRAMVRETLRGKNLACWCALDAPCHADVLLEIANGPTCEAVP